MPKIQFGPDVIECAVGDNLRKVLLKAKQPVYNPPMKTFNCRGFGTCGTCAVWVEGSLSEPTSVEQWRLGFPPHRRDSGLRLSCQCTVQGDLNVVKYPGTWGEKVGETPVKGTVRQTEKPTGTS